MKRVLLLTTGGTIASEPGPGGLAPRLGAGQLAQCLHEAYPRYHFEERELFRLDSSNVQPEHWRQIAAAVYESLRFYDGIVVTHGTDTMAYTSSAMSFLLQNLDRAVVFTGSQRPIADPLTDAQTNLFTAVAAIEQGMRGVLVAFNRKLINGARAVKVSTMDFDAFHSVNAGEMAVVYADGVRVHRHSTVPGAAKGPVRFLDGLCTDVALLKLLPGTRPELLDALGAMGYRGVVVEAFGAGGVHHIQRDLLEALRRLSAAGVAVVVCSQCLYERSDLELYEVGRRLLEQGVVSAGDMTTEAACTKLMWALHRMEAGEVAGAFARSYAGEVSLPGDCDSPVL